MTLKQKFKSAVKRGTGEAYLLMMEHPEADFSKELITASLRNLSYDNQCDMRADYVFGLIELSSRKSEIRQAILKALATETNDGWALDQLFELTGRFARQGDKEAREAIYKRFYANTIESCEDFGDDVIADLDGIAGLTYIAEVKTKAMQDESDLIGDHWFISNYQDKNPQINVYEALENVAKTNPAMRTYLDIVLKNKENQWKRKKREKYNYEVITRRINNKQPVYLFGRRKKELSQTDINRLADDFLKQTRRKTIEPYLQIFDRVKYPYDYQPLLKYATFPVKKSDRLVECACGSLKFFQGDDIRQLAMEKLNNIRVPAEYLDLLVSNYRKGDAKLLTDMVERCKNDDEIHSIVFGIIEIYKANKTKECKTPLEAMYDRLNCGIHRTDIVRLLIKNKALPERIKHELQYDSEQALRELHRAMNA